MAELTEESIAEEVLHLTAAVQYGGFWSVVRVQTMWEMAVANGQDLAFEFCVLGHRRVPRCTVLQETGRGVSRRCEDPVKKERD